jgi:hypothetical protein
VFYAISAWDPRKALPALLAAFVRAFRADDGVALVLKTGPVGYGAPPFYGQEPTLGMAQRASTPRPTRSTATRRRSACCPTSSRAAAST